METQVSVKQIIKDFIYIGNQLKDLFKDDLEYKPIIDFVLAKDYLDEELDIPFPKMKDIEAATNLKSHILRKLLLKMHSKIFTYERKLNLSFNKVIYHFYISYFNYRCQFTIDKLTHVPKIGETINLPFVSALIPINHFYVENITHELENDCQIVLITLKVGSYSPYFHFMKDRALELREIGIMEIYDLSESEIKKIIYNKSPYR